MASVSSGLGFSTILGCLSAGEDLTGLLAENWVSNGNPDQDLFAQSQLDWRGGLKFMDPASLKSYATYDYLDLIAKMAEWKMRLDTPPEGGAGAVYMLSQLKEMLKWKEKGERINRGVGWPEFKLKNVGFQSYGQGDGCLVPQIEVENGDTVYMARFPEPVSGMELYKAIAFIEKRMRPTYCGYSDAVAPCVYAEMEADLNWILGLMNGGYFISYAQQKIVYGMNEDGFAVREETDMMMERCMMPGKPFVLSLNGDPFLLWRRRPRVKFPISMFQFARANFEDPGDLSKIVD